MNAAQRSGVGRSNIDLSSAFPASPGWRDPRGALLHLGYGGKGANQAGDGGKARRGGCHGHTGRAGRLWRGELQNYREQGIDTATCGSTTKRFFPGVAPNLRGRNSAQNVIVISRGRIWGYPLLTCRTPPRPPGCGRGGVCELEVPGRDDAPSVPDRQIRGCADYPQARPAAPLPDELLRLTDLVRGRNEPEAETLTGPPVRPVRRFERRPGPSGCAARGR